MRILVTGAAGFIGSHLCERLLARGHDVAGLDAFVAFYDHALLEANLAPLLTQPRFRFHRLDLRSDDLPPALDGVQAVIHEAALPGLVRSWSDFDLYAACNLAATHRLLEACRDRNIERFIHISTSSVYGESAVGDESLPTRPVSPYGIAKLAAEQLALAYGRFFGLPAMVLRYFSIYGPRQRPDMAYSVFIERLLGGLPITVFGDGEQSRSNTYIDDCVEGTIQALEGGEPGEVYNIGGGRVITLNEAIGIIGGELGVRPVIRREPAHPGDQRHTAADCDKARRTFGYEPKVSPEEGLHRQVTWRLAQGIRE